ncbi:ribosome-binding factor A [Deinobacterium chartae]|uniref:Ribosome-binding factor A n=1 Tax=Deinobacterium chartae TaxID=521158 RepID=A0A841HXX2_9DEIO|nr:ribosome-binding factor A [Deinobacterium chartae]
MKPKQAEIAVARTLTAAIAELKDPRVPLIVTVERVQISPDLTQAKVFVSSLGEVAPLLEALQHARGHLQREVARALNLRRTPVLEFLEAGQSPFA